MEIKAYAKINLSLNITGLGKMHLLDSIMARIDLFDLVKISPAEKFSVEYDCDIEGGGSVQKAYDILRLHRGVAPISVKVKKGIPIGGGLGGSSADSAAIMKYFGITNGNISLKAGSDVPYMSADGYARVQGLGEKLTFFSAQTMWFVLRNAGSVMTKDSFTQFDRIYGKPYCPTDNDRLVEAMKRGELADVGKLMGNALTLPSVSLNPKIKDEIDMLRDFGPYGVTMTGSGGGVIALFGSEKDARKVADKTGGIAVKTIG